jgi:hypothetical protein
MSTSLSPLRRLGVFLGLSAPPSRPALDGFVDGLVQTFENCRPGLTDGVAGGAPAVVEEYFGALYEKERSRLPEIVGHQSAFLSEDAQADLARRVDEQVRSVVVPAYARVAGPFTCRERNDFYLSRHPWHGAERLAWAVAGMTLGAFVVWAPFIPLWSKEWVLVFAVGGLVFPELRRLVAFRRYETELNRIVARADAEIWRMDLAHLARTALGERAAAPRAMLEEILDEGAPVAADDDRDERDKRPARWAIKGRS